MVTRPVVVTRTLAVAVSFFVVAKLCQVVALESGTVTPVWFPSGIAFTAVLWSGRSVLPGIWAAASLAAATGILGAPVAVTKPEILIISALMGLGATIEPVIGVEMFRRVVRSANPFEDVRGLVWMSLSAGCIACASSATLGVSTLAFAGLVEARDFAVTWLTWWIGNTVGVILIAPLLIAWRRPPGWSRNTRTLAWNIALQSLILTASIAIFRLPLPGPFALAGTFAIIPPVVWSAYSFGPHSASASVLIFALTAVFHTAERMGPFVGESLNVSLLLLQTCIGIVAMTGLAMSAASVHRRALEKSTHALSNELAQSGRVSLTNELAAGVAHEVHQPLGVISNYANSCMIRLRNADGSPQDLIEPLSRIVAETARAAEAVRGIRRLLDRTPPREEPIDLETLIRDSVAVASSYNERASIAIRSYVDGPLPAIRGDTTQIAQVLTNLLVNALDALAGVSATDALIAVHAAAYRDGVAVTVSDNGPGLASDGLARCFDRFYTTKTGGLGMGLPICRTIVERHGGELSVHSARGRGATFRFTLAPQPLTMPIQR